MPSPDFSPMGESVSSTHLRRSSCIFLLINVPSASAPAHDLRTWAGALADGTLISKKMQEERLRWVDETDSPIGEKSGLGIEWRGGYIGFSGAIFGYRTEMYRVPSRRATMINIFNKLSAEPASTMERAAYRNMFIRMSRVLYPGSFPGVKDV